MQKQTKLSRRGILIELEVNGEVWRRVSSLEHSGPHDRHFVLTTNADGTTTLTFGDDKRGGHLPVGTDQLTTTYRPSKRYATVVSRQGRVIVDNDWNESNSGADRFFGLYRGIVKNNVDPQSLLRVQVQVPDISEAQLVWALPCVPVGTLSVPVVGALVWVAFERGDPALPVWMGTGATA